MTTQGWRPGPGDPSPAGWLLCAGYLVVAGFAWRAGRRASARGQTPHLWWVLAAGCAGLALNKQLDLHNAITAYGRGLARAEGWYRDRRTVQLGLLLGLAVAGTGALAWLWFRSGAATRPLRLAWTGLILLATFIGLRAASFHHLDTLLRTELGGVRLHAIVEAAGVALLLAATWSAARRADPPAA